MSASPWQYFTSEELTCQCGCGQMKMESGFMARVVAMRRELGFPFVVTSAYRCPDHNNSVSSTGRTGPHTTGSAIDIAVSHEQAFKFVECAYRHGMSGIGVSQKGDYRFIHIDDLSIPSRPRIWSY